MATNRHKRRKMKTALDFQEIFFVPFVPFCGHEI